MTKFKTQNRWLICCSIEKSKILGIVVPEGQTNRYFVSASFPCKGLVWQIFDMRMMKIWHGSISGNICLIEVSNPAKFDAFIKKRTILSLNSWTKFSSGHYTQKRKFKIPCNFIHSDNRICEANFLSY